MLQLPCSQPGIHVCYAGLIRRGDQNSWRSGVTAWREDRHSWRGGATVRVWRTKTEILGVPLALTVTPQDIRQDNTSNFHNLFCSSYKVNYWIFPYFDMISYTSVLIYRHVINYSDLNR